MINTLRNRFFGSSSVNLKSKIENLKWVGIVALVIRLAMGGAPVQAQQPAKIPQIGFVSTAALSSLSPRLDAFHQGLRELGYIENKNISIEYRSAEGKVGRLADLAAELVRSNVACIVTAGENPTRAAKQATNAIPIITTTVVDPVRDGFVTSLSRPGGNVTGLSTYATDLSGKRLELLKETVPKLSRVAFFNDSRSTEG